MPGSVDALAVFLVAALPGAVYLWSFERVLGPWGINFSDRVLRFVGTSAVIWTIYLPLGYLVWRYWIREATEGDALEWLDQRTAAGDALPWWLYFIPAAYVGLPALAGTLVARAVQSPKPYARRAGALIAGRDPAPRAWDDLFSRRPYGLVRAKLKADGAWVGGLFAKRSYAAGFPNPPDLLLEEAFRMADDGSFEVGADGFPVPVGSALLLSQEELAWIEFIETEGQNG